MSKRDELVAALDEADRACAEAERAWNEAYCALKEHDKAQEVAK